VDYYRIPINCICGNETSRLRFQCHQDCQDRDITERPGQERKTNMLKFDVLYLY
jgi:hypothetical protein